MSNWGTLVAAVKQSLSRGDSTEEVAKIKNAIVDAIRHCDQLDLHFQRRVDEIDIVESQFQYDILIGIDVANSDVSKINAVHLFDKSDDEHSWELAPIDPIDLWANLAETSTLSTEGTPRVYAWVSNQLHIWPVPQASDVTDYYLQVDFVGGPGRPTQAYVSSVWKWFVPFETDLVAGTEMTDAYTSEWFDTKNAYRLVYEYACYLYHQTYSRAPDLAQAHLQRYLEEETRLVTKTQALQGIKEISPTQLPGYGGRGRRHSWGRGRLYNWGF